MTNRDLASLLLRYPDLPVCVVANGVLREVERIRVTMNARYFPPVEEAIFAVGPAIVVEGLSEKGTGESAADPQMPFSD